MATYGGTLHLQSAPVTLGISSHTSTDDLVRVGREIIGRVIGVVSFSCSTTVKDKISNVRREERKETHANRQRRGNLYEKISTLSYYVSFYLSYFTPYLYLSLFRQPHPASRKDMNIVSIASISMHI